MGVLKYFFPHCFLMIYASNSEGNQHLSSKRTQDRIIANLCHSLDHKFYSRTKWNYFSWVLLLELVCIASPLRADVTGTMFGLLTARNHKHSSPFFRVWRVRKECGRWSPQVSNRKAQGAAPQGGTAALRTERAMMSNTWVTVVASKVFLSRCDKAHRASGARQEYRTRTSFL